MKQRKMDIGSGFLHLEIDSLDDLWALRNLIAEGDLVTASTYRTAESADDKIRSEKAEKKRMTLGVRVTDVEWHDFDDHLRVHGIIETGPQDLGRHHTHVLRAGRGEDVKINKPAPLAKWQRRIVKDAVEHAQRPQVLLLAIDDTDAQFAQLQAYGLRMLGNLAAGGQGKGYDAKTSQTAKRAFFDEIIRSLKAFREDATVPFLVVGPGWWREEFLEHAKQKAPDVVAGARTDGVSQAGEAGLREAMHRGLLQVVAREHRVELETNLVEEVFARIGKNGPVSYGPAEVLQALDAGAVETLLVTDELVRAGKDETLRKADQVGATVHIVSTGHDAGVRLQLMGGVAALLRFAV